MVGRQLLLFFAEAYELECLQCCQTAGDVSSADQHAIAFMHVVGFVYLTALTVNVVMTSRKPHLN